MNLKEDLTALLTAMKPMKSILFFILVLVAAHFFWKYNVIGDESGDTVTFWGLDISSPFIFMTNHIVNVVENILHLLQIKYHQHAGNQICFETHHRVTIVWGCTGIKQSFIFLCLLLFTPGPWKHKLWYIPMGLFLAYIFNLARITIITLSVENHPEWFHFLHERLLKYLFYALLFAIWVIWEEKFNRKSSFSKKENSDS